MKTRTEWTIAQIFGRFMLVVMGAILAAGTAWGQQGSCVVSQIQLSIGTGGVEEVMTGNLDIEVHLANGIQKAQVIGAVWLDNTTNTVPIQLNQAVGVSEIKSIKMTYTSAPGFEQWLMSSFNATASGKGVIANIATSGPYQFDWTTTVFEINTVAAPCRPGITRIEGPVYVAPGTPVESRQLLTNDEVVRMIRAGMPEPTIVASIRSNPTQFDMSADGVAKLRQIGISENILREMQNRSADPNNNLKVKLSATDGGKNADDLNPQPYPPKSNATNQTLLSSGTQQTMLGTHAGSSAGNQSTLLPAVQQPAITDGTTQGAITGNGKTAITDGTVTGGIRPASTPAIGASQTMSASGNVLAGTAAQPPASIAVAAATPNGKPQVRMLDPTTFCKEEIVDGQVLTRISTVDGENVAQVPFVAGSAPGIPIIAGVVSGGPVFTPGKHYVIHGCGFGAAAGQVLIWGNNNFRVKLYLQQWSDQWIDVVVDPTASGPAQPVVLAVLTAGTSTVRNDVIGAGVGEATAFAVSFAPNGPTQADTMGSRFSIANVNAASQARTSANALTNPARNLDVRGAPGVIRENPNVFVAQACAANSGYRVLSISGLSSGNTLIVGPQYTIYGCSFGNPPQVKSSTRPIRQSSQTGRVSPPTGYYVGIWVSIKSQFTGLIYGQVQSWSDNAIVVTFPASLAVNDGGTSLSGPAVATRLWLTRGDGQTTIYGPEGGLYFKPAN